MSQEDLLIHIFCLIDDLFKAVKPPRLRAHGPTPRLADSEVIALACFGELLGFDTDKGIFAMGRRHFPHLFPTLGRVSRTTSCGRPPISGGSWGCFRSGWPRPFWPAAPSRRSG